jgi:hypothetical protein|tara:strand:+ start:109 stop:330 length:222 start_codon:yes stop_codon:yes gene_type:complete
MKRFLIEESEASKLKKNKDLFFRQIPFAAEATFPGSLPVTEDKESFRLSLGLATGLASELKIKLTPYTEDSLR